MTAREVALRVVGAALLLVAGGFILWAGMFGMWGLPMLFGPEDKPTLIVVLLTCILVMALGFFVAVMGLGMIAKLLARGAKALLQ